MTRRLSDLDNENQRDDWSRVEPLKPRQLKRVKGTGASCDPTAGERPNSGGTFCACGCPDLNQCC
jgi:hypothetical protein